MQSNLHENSSDRAEQIQKLKEKLSEMESELSSQYTDESQKGKVREELKKITKTFIDLFDKLNIFKSIKDLHKENKISDEDFIFLFNKHLENIKKLSEEIESKYRKTNNESNISREQQYVKPEKDLDTVLSTKKESSDEPLTSKEKLKSFIIACLSQAYEYKFDTKSKTLLRYSDPTHDIDDQITIAKELVSTIFFGGETVYRISGHLPFSSIKMHKDLLEKISDLKDDLLKEIEQSQMLKPEFKRFIKENCQDKKHKVHFLPYLTKDIQSPEKKVGRVDFFNNTNEESYEDYYFRLLLKKDPSKIKSINEESFRKSLDHLKESQYQDKLEVSIISQFDDLELSNLTSEIGSLQFHNKNLTSQGSEQDFNFLEIKQKGNLTEFYRKFDHHVVCSSKLTKEYGFGLIYPSSFTDNSFLTPVAQDLIESYEICKQDGWLISGFPMKLDENQEPIPHPIGDKLILSFAGILAYNELAYNSSNYPTKTLEKSLLGTDAMSPIRFIGEHRIKDQSTGNFISRQIKVSDDRSRIEFEDDKHKDLALEFYKFYQKSEIEIFEKFIRELSTEEKTSLEINSITNCDDEESMRIIKNSLMKILSKENSSTIKDSIARKLIQTIANQYKDPSKNPIKFYKDKLKEFRLKNPYSPPSLAYDTVVPAISSLVLNDSPLFNKLLDFQNSHQTNSQDNHNHGSKLVISEILIKKIKELIDEGSELDPEINEFYQKVEKLKITLNDPAFNSQDAIKSSLQEISNSKEENIKHLYSVKIINGIINIPVYSEVGKYKPIENNNFQEFVLKCKEKPEAGHSYLPYFDAVGNPHLMKIKKEQNLTNPNQYQIKLFNTVNKEAFSSDFDLPNLSVNNSQTYYLQARETLPRPLFAYQQSHSYGQDYPMQISAQQYSVTPSFPNPVPLTYYQQHPQQSQFLSYYQQQPQYPQQSQYRQYDYMAGQLSHLGHQQHYPSGSFQPNLFRNLGNRRPSRNSYGANQ